MPGTQSTFLLLVGDGGLYPHNLGNAFAAAAQTQAYLLNSQGHRVIACRVSSVQNFDDALLGHLQDESLNGQIDGGVIYFGHSGQYSPPGTTYTFSILAPGQEQGPDTNVTFDNLYELGNVVDNNMLGGSASIWLNGCNAGLDIYDAYARYKTSIAKGLSIILHRPVYAYDVGTYFSRRDAASDKHYNGEGFLAPETPPAYAVPAGPPGHKPGYVRFVNGEVKNQ
jgi:hypothetical protein